MRLLVLCVSLFILLFINTDSIEAMTRPYSTPCRFNGILLHVSDVSPTKEISISKLSFFPIQIQLEGYCSSFLKKVVIEGDVWWSSWSTFAGGKTEKTIINPEELNKGILISGNIDSYNMQITDLKRFSFADLKVGLPNIFILIPLLAIIAGLFIIKKVKATHKPSSDKVH